MTNEEERLVTDNINLANDIAWKYSKKFKGFIPFEELQSLAYLGLVKAAGTFDSNLGTTFSTYAYIVMKNEIVIYFRDNSKYLNNISLSRQVCEEIAVIDTIPDKFDMLEHISTQDSIDKLRLEINTLPDRYRYIMIYRYFGVTMTIIGMLLNISQPQVSRDYQRGLDMLRRRFKVNEE